MLKHTSGQLLKNNTYHSGAIYVAKIIMLFHLVAVFISSLIFNYRLPYGGCSREERDHVAMHTIWLGLIFRMHTKLIDLITVHQQPDVNQSNEEKQLNVVSDANKTFKKAKKIFLLNVPRKSTFVSIYVYNYRVYRNYVWNSPDLNILHQPHISEEDS